MLLTRCFVKIFRQTLPQFPRWFRSRNAYPTWSRLHSQLHKRSLEQRPLLGFGAEFWTGGFDREWQNSAVSVCKNPHGEVMGAMEVALRELYETGAMSGKGKVEHVIWVSVRIEVIFSTSGSFFGWCFLVLGECTRHLRLQHMGVGLPKVKKLACKRLAEGSKKAAEAAMVSSFDLLWRMRVGKCCWTACNALDSMDGRSNWVVLWPSWMSSPRRWQQASAWEYEAKSLIEMGRWLYRWDGSIISRVPISKCWMKIESWKILSYILPHISGSITVTWRCPKGSLVRESAESDLASVMETVEFCHLENSEI